MKSPGCVQQGRQWGGAALKRQGLRAQGELCPASGSPQRPRFELSAAMPSPRAKSVAGTGQAEPLECRVLGKAGHGGCYEANLASIKASFRAAKPFPYVSLWELQSPGEGIAERQAEAEWPHPRVLHKPVVWLAWEWVPDPGG